MHFTYLLEGPSEPAQELLQKYGYYAVIVTLSEDMSNFVLENSGFELKISKDLLCWLLVQPQHFETAPKGSTLHQLHEVIKNKNLYGSIEHSFLAFASRDDLINNSGGHYIPLHLHLEDNEEKRKKIIGNAVKEALSATKPKYSAVSIEMGLSAASFVATLIGFFPK